MSKVQTLQTWLSQQGLESLVIKFFGACHILLLPPTVEPGQKDTVDSWVALYGILAFDFYEVGQSAHDVLFSCSGDVVHGASVLDTLFGNVGSRWGLALWGREQDAPGRGNLSKKFRSTSRLFESSSRALRWKRIERLVLDIILLERSSHYRIHHSVVRSVTMEHSSLARRSPIIKFNATQKLAILK